jgi:hypothetical protein
MVERPLSGRTRAGVHGDAAGPLHFRAGVPGACGGAHFQSACVGLCVVPVCMLLDAASSHAGRCLRA